jgi:hypothetical protein
MARAHLTADATPGGELRASLFALALALVATVFAGGAVGFAQAQSPGPGQGADQPAVSRLVIDRSTGAAKRPFPRLWVGLIVGVFGLGGLIASRVFRPLEPSGSSAGRLRA